MSKPFLKRVPLGACKLSTRYEAVFFECDAISKLVEIKSRGKKGGIKKSMLVFSLYSEMPQINRAKLNILREIGNEIQYLKNVGYKISVCVGLDSSRLRIARKPYK